MSRLTSVVASAFQAAGNFATNLRHKPEEAVAEPRDLVACAADGTPAEKEWTVLVYLDGRQRLAYSAVSALKALESVGSSDQVNVVAQATVEPTLPERIYEGVRPSTTRRYFDGKCVGDLGESQALSQQSLGDFLKWGVKSFPAKHYMVVVKKHGMGFAKSEPVAPLSAREMDEALEGVVAQTGRKVDVVAFDSCSMQQMEVAYQLKDDARVMVGSQEDIFAIDYPYAKIVTDLKAAPTSDAAAVGRIVVDAHRQDVKRGMQTAVDLDRVGACSTAIHGLVDAIVSEGVPREVVYTNMLEASSMEPQESMRFTYDFRDLRGFLHGLANDPEVKSERVRDAARQAESAVAATVIDHSISDAKKKIKNATGLTAFVPWKAPTSSLEASYGQLAWDKDASWMRLVDYVFDGDASTSQASDKVSAASDLSLTQRLGKAAIQQYKQYISPHLLVSCRYEPSCSQYTREAIEKHGLIQGSKLGFMRLLSCSGHGDKHDPVPEVGETPAQAHNHPYVAPETAPRVLLAPPPRVEKSDRRRGIEHRLIAATRLAGRMVGGTLGAVACLAPGIAFGATLGWKAGRATIDQLNRDLLKSYRRESVAQLVELEHLMGDPGFAVFKKVKSWTGSNAVAGAIGGVAGGVIGGMAGALGGLYKGYRWGALFGGLWSANVLKDKLGELPKHPVTEAILRHDYGKAEKA